jgi:hypothetical protein
MKRALAVSAAAASVLLLLAPLPARAGEDDALVRLITVGVIAGTALVVTDVVMVVSDGGDALRSAVPSRNYGVAEIAVGLPQAAMGGVLIWAFLGPYSGTNSNWGAAAAGCWMALGAGLAAHGVWTLNNQERGGPAPPKLGRRSTVAGTSSPGLLVQRAGPKSRLAVAPTWLESGGRSGPGVAALLLF